MSEPRILTPTLLDTCDAIHASPPCQAHTTMSNGLPVCIQPGGWYWPGNMPPDVLDALVAAVRASEQAPRLRADATLPDVDAVLAWIYTHDHPSIAYPTDHTYRVIVTAALAAITDLLTGVTDGD